MLVGGQSWSDADVSNMILYKRLIPTAAAASLGTGAANLLTADPKEVLAYTGTGAQNLIDIDLGSAQSIDSLLLGYFSWSGGADPAVSLWRGTATYTDTLVVSGSALAPSSVSSPLRRHFFHRFSSPQTARYIRFAPTTVNAITYQIGIVAIGLAFQPTYNREWGSGRRIIDTGTKEALLGGGFGIGEGARKSAFRWTFGDLTDAEVASLFDLGLDRGETRPIVVVEDPDVTSGLNERIHYGLFERLEPYERQNVSQTRWSLEVQQWV
jgi:hypothetical protein